MSPNDADGMANSVDPDQTAPLGAVWSGSALFAQAYLSENLGLLLYTYFTDCGDVSGMITGCIISYSFLNSGLTNSVMCLVRKPQRENVLVASLKIQASSNKTEAIC